MLWELIKWSPKRKYLDLLSNSLNLFFKKIYKDQFGEFVCEYWGLSPYHENKYSKFFDQFKFSGCVIRTEQTSLHAVVKRYVKRFQPILDPSSDQELISSLQIKRKIMALRIKNTCDCPKQLLKI